MGVRAIANAARLPGGLVQALQLMRRFDPNVALVSGGYVSAPIVAAAAVLRVPLVVLTLEIDHGWVNLAAARVAAAVTASYPPAMAQLPPERTVLTGYPVRDEFLHLDRARARAALELDADLPVLAVFGGSQGSHHINEALAGTLPDLLLATQVLHICGEADLPGLEERRSQVPATLRGRYRLFDYLPAGEMANVLSVDRLAVCRAGASTLAELPLAGLPAIMVPGPFSSQPVNADYLREEGAVDGNRRCRPDTRCPSRGSPGAAPRPAAPGRDGREDAGVGEAGCRRGHRRDRAPCGGGGPAMRHVVPALRRRG